MPWRVKSLFLSRLSYGYSVIISAYANWWRYVAFLLLPTSELVLGQARLCGAGCQTYS